METPFALLPIGELQDYVLAYFTFAELFPLLLCNKATYRLVTRRPMVWFELFKREFSQKWKHRPHRLAFPMYDQYFNSPFLDYLRGLESKNCVLLQNSCLKDHCKFDPVRKWVLNIIPIRFKGRMQLKMRCNAKEHYEKAETKDYTFEEVTLLISI